MGNGGKNVDEEIKRAQKKKKKQYSETVLSDRLRTRFTEEIFMI